MTTPTAESICTTAAQLVGGDRESTHGDKTINYANVADLWNGLLSAKARSLGATYIPFLTALDALNMMEALKIARRYSGAHNIDDYIDGAGYAGCAGEVAEKLLNPSHGSADPPATAQLGPGAAPAAPGEGNLRLVETPLEGGSP